MTITAHAPDGATLNFPDGTADAVIDKAMKEHIQNAPSYAGEIGKGLARGPLSNFGGLIADIATLKPLREEPEWYTEMKAKRGDTKPGILSPATPSYGERIAKGLGIEPSPDASTGQAVAGSVAENLTNPLNYVGGRAVPNVVGAVAGGVGSELLGELGEKVGGRTGEAIGRVVGGAAGQGVVGAAERQRQYRSQAFPLMDEPQIQAQSQKHYQWLDNHPVQMTPASIQDLHATLITDLTKNNASPITAGQTFQFVHQLRPGNIAIGDTKDVLQLHNQLGQVDPVTRPPDGRAAQVARESIRNWLIDNLPKGADKNLRNAVGNWAAYEKIKDVRKSLEVAIHRAEVSGSNKNAINTMRQEVRKIIDSDRRSRGYSQAANEQAELIVGGSWLENRAREIGKAVPYSSGFAFLYSMMQGAVSWPLVGVSGITYTARKLGDFLTRRQIQRLIQIMQEEAPANKWRVSRNRGINARLPPLGTIGTLRGAAEGLESDQSRDDVLDNPSGIPLQ